MQDISKPRIVDFLRTCDKLNWVHPRIRFASVRSKPELIEDIEMNFTVDREGSFINIVPRKSSRRIPSIQFDLDSRQYLLDGEYHELQKESRRRPEFSISHEETTIEFGDFHMCVDPHATRTTFAASSPFLALSTGGGPVVSS